MTPHRHHPLVRGGTAFSRAAFLVLLLAALCLVPGPEPAAASIVDDDAPPDDLVVLASAGDDYAGELLISRNTVYVAGRVSDGGGGTDPSLLRLPVGNATASRTTLAGVNGVASDIVLGRSGAVYTSGNIVLADGRTRVSVIKWTASGKVSWHRTYAGTTAGYHGAMDVGADRAGNVVACAQSAGRYGADWAVISWSPAGKKRWVWRYSGPGRGLDSPAELLVDASGNTYVTGTVTLTGDVTAAYTVKLSPKGRRLWARTYRGPEGLGAVAAAIARRPGGGVYVGGSAERSAGGSDAVLVRYTSTGRPTVYPTVHAGAAAADTRAYDIAVTTRGDIVGVGAANNDRFRCVWSTPTGSIQTFVWPTTYSDALMRVAADPFGGVVTVGTVATGASTLAIETIRTPVRATGLLWTYQWPGPLAGRPTTGGVVASGGVVAASGSCISAATGRDQFIQVWRY